MILNTAIFTATIEAAKAKAANRPEVLRAIDRAVIEIQKAAYWSFADGVLTIKSTTSGEMYKVDAAHDCPAHSRVCKHHIARLLMVRYSERLATVEAAPRTVAPAVERHSFRSNGEQISIAAAKSKPLVIDGWDL